MRILLLSSLTPATGNLTSAQRIKMHFEHAGHTVTMHDIHIEEPLHNILQCHHIDAVFGIHAERAGRLLQHCHLPYGLLLSGPDIASFATSSPEQQSIMTKAIAEARIVSTYHTYFQQQAKNVWPKHASKIIAIPKAVTVQPSTFSLRKALAIPPSSILFLHICGIRPVKDPLFLLEILTQWHAKNPDITTVIIGQILDKEYAAKVLPLIQKTPKIIYYQPLPRPDLHSAICESDAVINTALIEGMPNALLEAMALGTPIIARNIPGNACFIQDNITGMLFATPKEFQQKASILLLNKQLRTSIIRHAQLDIKTNHTLMQECEGYQTQVLPHL